jgi:hypothetical protein
MLYHGQIIFKEYTVHREGGKKFADMQCIRADTLNFEKRAEVCYSNVTNSFPYSKRCHRIFL